MPSPSGAVSPSRRRIDAVVLRLLGALMLSLVLAGFAASEASAASHIRGCFTYNGRAIANVTTTTEYETTSGGWRQFGGQGHTLQDGCVDYNVSGRPQNWYLRIHAFAFIAGTRYVVIANSFYKSRPGTGSSRLGTGYLKLYRLPSVATPAPSANTFGGVNTSSWLDAMDHPNCNQSAAMAVACYMDRNGLHGNVIAHGYLYLPPYR
jgi:hypothetical protein